MIAVLNNKLRTELYIYYSKRHLCTIRRRLLEFVRGTGYLDTEVGLCTNFGVNHIVDAMGDSYPIKGKPWESNMSVYCNSRASGKLYQGDQLKQRRKLAVRIIKIIDQYLKERDNGEI